MASRKALIAYNRQIRQLPAEVLERECGLVEVGRQHARDFDSGHSPSGGRVLRVLAELRKLAAVSSAAAVVVDERPRSALDDLAARRAARLSDAADSQRPAAGQ